MNSQKHNSQMTTNKWYKFRINLHIIAKVQDKINKNASNIDFGRKNELNSTWKIFLSFIWVVPLAERSPQPPTRDKITFINKG